MALSLVLLLVLVAVVRIVALSSPVTASELRLSSRSPFHSGSDTLFSSHVTARWAAVTVTSRRLRLRLEAESVSERSVGPGAAQNHDGTTHSLAVPVTARPQRHRAESRVSWSGSRYG